MSYQITLHCNKSNVVQILIFFYRFYKKFVFLFQCFCLKEPIRETKNFVRKNLPFVMKFFFETKYFQICVKIFLLKIRFILKFHKIQFSKRNFITHTKVIVYGKYIRKNSPGGHFCITHFVHSYFAQISYSHVNFKL